MKQDTGTFPKVSKGVTFTLEKSEVHEIPAKPKRTPKVPRSYQCTFHHFIDIIGSKGLYIIISNLLSFKIKKIERRSKSAPGKSAAQENLLPPNRFAGNI